MADQQREPNPARDDAGDDLTQGLRHRQQQTAVRQWWNGLRPYQREVTWTALFGLAGIALAAMALVLVAVLWPDVPLTGNGLGVAIVMAAAVGVASGLGGMFLGYRIENRHQRGQD